MNNPCFRFFFLFIILMGMLLGPSMPRAAPQKAIDTITDADIDAMMRAPMPPPPKPSEGPDTASPLAEETDVKPGMQSLRVTGADRQKPATHEEPQSKKEAATPIDRSYPPLSAKDALVTPDKLTSWPNLGLIVGVKTRDDALNLIKAIEADRGAVPPQALFLAARILGEKGLMEQAALYYFVAQLRLTFDVTRWPPQVSPEDLAKITADKNKADEQKQATDFNPLRVNPHSGISALGSAISKPILRWAMADRGRFHAALMAAQEWDSSATYAYHPGYDVGKGADFTQWENILIGVRSNYFMMMERVAKDIQMKPAASATGGIPETTYDE